MEMPNILIFILYFLLFETGFYYEAVAGLKHSKIYLTLRLESWDQRYAPPCSVEKKSLDYFIMNVP